MDNVIRTRNFGQSRGNKEFGILDILLYHKFTSSLINDPGGFAVLFEAILLAGGRVWWGLA